MAADPGVLRRVGDQGAVWIVDPVDGTNNFAAGKTPFAVMVALLRDGEPAAAWILDVVEDRMTVAEAGGGAYLDGVRVKTRTDDPGAAVAARRGRPASTCRPTCGPGPPPTRTGWPASPPGTTARGTSIPAVATDEQQFALFWRILPWDHVPGSLILREAGGTVLHLDGTRVPPDGQRAWPARRSQRGRLAHGPGHAVPRLRLRGLKLRDQHDLVAGRVDDPGHPLAPGHVRRVPRRSACRPPAAGPPPCRNRRRRRTASTRRTGRAPRPRPGRVRRRRASA